MSQALEIYDKIQDPLKDLKTVGLSVAKSGFYGVDRAEAGEMIWLICVSERITPLQFFRTYDVVLGKPRKKAMACFAEFRQRGGKVKWISTGDDGKEAEGEFTFEGQSLKVKFTIEDAKRQNLVKSDSAWQKTPGNMLRARVITNAIGMLCPEIVAGMVDGDEETPTPEPKPLLPKEPKPAKVDSSKVVDAEIVQPAAQPATPPPAPPTATETATVSHELRNATGLPAVAEPQKHVAQVGGNGKLTPETVAALMDVIPGDKQEAALKWMEEKKWIVPMGGIGDLSQARAQKIFDRPAAFIEAVSGKKEGK